MLSDSSRTAGAAQNPPWLITIWILLWFIIASAPVRVVFFPNSTFVASAFTYAVQTFTIYVLFLGLLRFRGTLPRPMSPIERWTLVYVSLAVLSTFLSPYLAQGSPVEPILLLLQDMGIIVTIFIIFRICGDEHSLIRSFVWAYASGTFLFVVGLLFFSDALSQWSRVGRLGTDLVAPTTIAMRTGLASLLLITLPKELRLKAPLRLPLIAVFLLTTLLAFGKTVIGALAISLVTWLFLQSGSQMWKSALAVVGLVAAVALLFGDLLYAQLMSYVQNPRTLTTLTGRTVLWAATIDVIMERPFLGNGYGLYERVIRPALPEWHQKREINQAHNAYLDALVKLGVLGLLALLRVIQQTTRDLYHIWKRALGTDLTRHLCLQGIPVVIFLLVRSVVEGALNGSLDFAVLIVYGFWAHAAVRRWSTPAAASE